MKKALYNLLAAFVKKVVKGKIVGKTIRGFNKKLYYEKAQHLNFIFQSQVNYEGHLLKTIQKYIKSGDVIFDIGANIGQYAIPFSELVGPKGKVYAFEPDYKNYSYLQFNVNINRCINVICLNYGVGGKNTEQEFFRDTETGGRKGSFKKEYVEDSFKGLTETVQIKKMDTLIAKFGVPDFVKIDIEGFEEEVILSLTHKLDNCVFFVEVRTKTKDKIFEYFKLKGYSCICIDKAEIEVHKAEELSNLANLIFIKKK